MQVRKRLAPFCLLLMSLLFLTSCTSEEIAKIDAIVTVAETLVPLIPSLSPADAQSVRAYMKSVLSVTNDVLQNPTAAGASKAVSDFNQLVVPKLDASASPETQKAISRCADVIQAFIAAFTPPSASFHFTDVRFGQALVESGKAKPFQLKPKDKKKLDDLKERVKTARVKLRNKK